jgi:serine/threonine-protein kinase
MDPTRTITAPPDGVPTAPYRPADPGEAMQIAPAAGTDMRADAELGPLLRKRLRAVGGFLSLIHLFFAVTSGLFLVNDPHRTREMLVAYASVPLVTGAILATTAVVWSGASLNLTQLRAAELAYVGVLLAHQAFGFLWAAATLVPTAPDPGAVFSYVRVLYDLNSFVVVVGYGVMIPNTGRRCARVVGMLAIVPLAVHLLPMLAGDSIRDRGPIFLQGVVLSVLYMAAAAAIAIYGSHRIETLRRQASAARRLGQYVLREKLGGGGMGEVYRAEHALLRRPAAIKLIRPERAGDPATLARFEREVQATATLTHPNTVQVYDYGRAEDGTFYYVMEYLPGVTLDGLVARDGPLPPGRAVRLLRQLCGALREAHGIGLVHRDIKPGNVMVCDRGGVPDTVKLLDFGLVRPAVAAADERLTQEGAVFGTPAYLSPEQAGGHAEPDTRSDVYSLGALAYFLLTGRPPFADRSAVKMLAAHLYETPTPPSAHRAEVPAELDAVVLRCLEKKPGDRCQTVDELDSALAACGATGLVLQSERGP